MTSILKVDTIQDQSGNNIINENADTITIGASGDTITVPTGASLTVPNGGLTGQNYPAFMAYLSSAQSISDATFTKIQFDTEVLDTDNCYDNSTNYRFTPTTAGKYLVNCYTASSTGTNTDILRHYQAIYKNGSQVQLQNLDTRDGGGFRVLSISSSYIISMNGSSDYIEIFAYADSNSGTNASITGGSTEHSFFSAFRIGA
jgi:hypothetical protein